MCGLGPARCLASSGCRGRPRGTPQALTMCELQMAAVQGTGPGQPAGHPNTCAFDTWRLPSADKCTQLLLNFSQAVQKACLLNP